MKLLRFGSPGKEKPELLDKSGTIRDLSGLVGDISQETLLPENLKILHSYSERMKIYEEVYFV